MTNGSNPFNFFKLRSMHVLFHSTQQNAASPWQRLTMHTNVI